MEDTGIVKASDGTPRDGERPFCHWCEHRHAGERKGADGKYCPGPLLEPDSSWSR
jgi:hypothetical protein